MIEHLIGKKILVTGFDGDLKKRLIAVLRRLPAMVTENNTGTADFGFRLLSVCQSAHKSPRPSVTLTPITVCIVTSSGGVADRYVTIPEIYGCRYHDDTITSMIRNAVDVINGVSDFIRVYDNPRNEREFLHIDDAVEGIIVSSSPIYKNYSRIVLRGHKVFISDIVGIILDSFGLRGAPVIYYGDNIRSNNFDDENTISINPRRTLDEGIRRTIESIRFRL